MRNYSAFASGPVGGLWSFAAVSIQLDRSRRYKRQGARALVPLIRHFRHDRQLGPGGAQPVLCNGLNQCANSRFLHAQGAVDFALEVLGAAVDDPRLVMEEPPNFSGGHISKLRQVSKSNSHAVEGSATSSEANLSIRWHDGPFVIDVLRT